MRVSDALGQIAAIHQQLAKGEVYRGFHPLGVALAGLVGFAAGAAQPWLVGADDPRLRRTAGAQGRDGDGEHERPQDAQHEDGDEELDEGEAALVSPGERSKRTRQHCDACFFSVVLKDLLYAAVVFPSDALVAAAVTLTLLLVPMFEPVGKTALNR